MSFSPGGGVRDVSGGMEEWITKTNHDKRRGSFFVTHWMGLPLTGSPLVFLPPLFHRRARMIRPSHWKGEGRWRVRVRPDCVLLRLVGVLVIGPTSLKGGEGLLARYLRGIRDSEGEGGGGRMREDKDKIDRVTRVTWIKPPLTDNDNGRSPRLVVRLKDCKFR